MSERNCTKKRRDVNSNPRQSMYRVGRTYGRAHIGMRERGRSWGEGGGRGEGGERAAANTLLHRAQLGRQLI